MSKVIEFVKGHKKLITVAIAVTTLTGVAFIYPEHAETVARAFLILVGAL